jgi:hypothetical protein
MIYNGFVVTDTRDNTGTESNYDTPAYGPSANNAPLPGLGGAGWNNPPANGQPSSSSGSGNRQQWINPETINATLQLAGGITNMIAAGKTGETAKIKAVCGPQPLLNIGGKKDTYRACADRVIAQSNQPAPQVFMPPARVGMSTTSKVLIGVGILIFIIMIIVLVIYMSKQKATK